MSNHLILESSQPTFFPAIAGKAISNYTLLRHEKPKAAVDAHLITASAVFCFYTHSHKNFAMRKITTTSASETSVCNRNKQSWIVSIRRLMMSWLMVGVLLAIGSVAKAQVNHLVISQVYGGGGNSGATYQNDFIELFNPTLAPISINGWSVQYAATTGTNWQVTSLPNATIAPGQYFLIQQDGSIANGIALPTPDHIDNIAMGQAAGKVALLNTTTAITNGTSCPTGPTVVDFVGYGGGTNCVEGAGPTPTPSAMNSLLRGSSGCTDTDINSADFGTGPANPRNSLAAAVQCTYISAQDGEWNTGATWVGGSVPPLNASVIIDHAVTINGGTGISSITINSTKSLEILGSNNLSLSGSWTNNGTFIPNTSTVTVNGTNNLQTISGTNNFYNLTISRSGVNLHAIASGTLNVNGLLVINSGKLITSGQFNNVQINSTGTLESDGGTINVSGNWTRASGAFNATTGTLVFNGTVNQTVTNTSTTFIHKLVVNNTGPSGNNTVAFNQAATFSSAANTITLQAGLLQTVSNWDLPAAGGTLTSNGGDLTPSGTIRFLGAGTVSGTVTFNNAWLFGPVDFGTGSTVNGTLHLDGSSGAVVNNAPLYGNSSTLFYVGGITRTIGIEWPAGTTGSSIPNNVDIRSNTTLNMASVGPRNCRGTMLVAFGTLNMQTMTGPLTVASDFGINPSASFIMGSVSGSDVFIGGSFSNSGTFTNSGRTVTLTGSGSIGGFNGANSLFNIVFNGGAYVATTAIIDVSNDLTINSGSFTGPTSITEIRVGGNWTNNAIYTSGSGAVVFNGSGTQIIGGASVTTFGNLAGQGGLTINKSSGQVILSTDVSVAGLLKLTNGIINGTTNSKTLTVSPTGSAETGSDASHVSGKLARVYTAIGSKNFPIGKGGLCRPVTLNFTTLTGGPATVTAEQFESVFPGAFDAGYVALGSDRYWHIEKSGGTTIVYNVTLDGTGTSPDDPADVKLFKFDNPSTTTSHSTTFSSPNYTATGLTSLSDFALGDLDCIPPSIFVGGQPQPTQTVCHNATIPDLSVTATGDGLTYQWYSSDDNATNTSGDDVGLGTGSTQPVITGTVGTKYYYCVVTGTCGTFTSNTAEIIVNTNFTPAVSLALTGGANPTCAGNSVQFTATATGSGAGSVSYNFKVNDISQQISGSHLYLYTPANNDIVTVEITVTGQTCLTSATAASDPITVTVNNYVTPLLTLAASSEDICAGTAVTFTASASNLGGGSITAYIFRINSGIVQNSMSNIYTSSTLVDDDFVNCEIIVAGGNCLTTNAVTSNGFVMNVTPNSTPTVGLTASPSGPICAGELVTFTANAANMGTLGFASNYNFKINGLTALSTTFNQFQTNALNNGDIVTCEITVSGGTCLTSTTATSTGITMTVNTPITWYQDLDGDNYGNTSVSQLSCTQPANFVATGGDCADNNTAINPGATELCNGFDDNCNSQVDEGFPEIDVQGNSVSIVDGDATPSLSDHTDFGTVSTSGNLVRTYTIENTSATALTINSISTVGVDAAKFLVGSVPASVTPGGTATFTVTFTPLSVGTKLATVSINSDDCDESPYSFVVTGEGVITCVPSVHNVNTGLNYCTIQAAINAVETVAGHEIIVDAGTYNEDVTISKSIKLTGAGALTTTIIGPIGGPQSTVAITSSGVEISGFTITRAGNALATWNDPNLNSPGIAIQGTSITGANIHSNIITQNRSGIDINSSSGHNIHNNRIADNHTGLIFRNATDNISFTENEVTGNRTVGILFLDASGGSNIPVQTALNGTFFNNNISGNWYGQIVDRQAGGSLPAPGTTNPKNFSGNWLGSSTPVITTANSAEPGYATHIPVSFGGTATAPGGQPDIAGPASANFDYTPYLNSNTDTDGEFGFQGDFSYLNVTASGAQTGSTARIQEGVNMVSGSTVNVAAGTYVENVVINSDLNLLGANAGVACGSRGAESIIAPTSGIPVTITSDDVTVDGFEISAPASVYAIECGNTSNLNIRFNNIHNIGSSLTSGNIHAINYSLGSTAKSGVSINDNCFNNISSASLSGSSASAIGILQSLSTGTLTNLNIERNTINNVNVNTATWPTGKIAYGIVINVGSNSYQTSTGKVVNAIIRNNEISNLEGFISTAIGLEGNTEDAVVENNLVTDLTGYKSDARAGGGYDLNGLKFENNRYVSTITVRDNSFATNTFTHNTTAGLGYAVANYVPSSVGGDATLVCNWFGTSVYNEVADNVTLTGKIFNKDFCVTNFAPYRTSGVDATPAVTGFQPSDVCAPPCTVGVTASSTDATCPTINNGTATATVTNNVGTVSYSWNTIPVQTTATATGLTAGTYTVTVTDINGCVATANVNVLNSPSTPVQNVNTGQYYCTIQAAINDALTLDGHVITVASGTYTENVTVNKRLTIDGAGLASTQINGSITIAASGLNAGTRLIIKELSVTNGSGTGITFNAGVSYVTIESVSSSNNSANGIEIVGGTAGNDLELENMQVNDNGTNGIRMGGIQNLNGLTIDGGEFKRNNVIGLAFNPSGNAGSILNNLSITGTVFEHNGDQSFSGQIAPAGLGWGDVSMFAFNGNASLTNVTITGLPANGSHIGLQFRGSNTPAASGVISLNNVTVTGSYLRPSNHVSDPGGAGFGILIQNYSDVSNITFNNVSSSTTDGHALFAAGLTNTLNIGNTSLAASNANSGHIVIGTSSQNPVLSNVDATGATFNAVLASTASLAQLFAIEDKILHAIDVTGLGFATVKSNNAYVTVNSFLSPFSLTPSIQRGINTASNGWTVNVGDGTYNEDIDINKAITVDGQSTNAVIRGLNSGSANTVIISSSNATLKDVTVTRNWGTTQASWDAAVKNQGIVVGQLTTGIVIDGVRLVANRNAIYINNAQNVTVQNCVIEDNRTGVHFANDVSGCIVRNNFIRNNFTHGVLLNFDTPPGIIAQNLLVNNNSITGNWYSEVNFQHNNNSIPFGSLAGIDFTCNWYGTLTPTVAAVSAAEPGYVGQVPSQLGGTNPGVNPSELYGTEIALCPYIPWLTNGTDNDANESTGFQPVPGSCNGVPATQYYVNDNVSDGNDVYTSAVGNDANPGTAAAPFRTIAKAILVATSGNTIFVDAGTFQEQVIVNESLTITGADRTKTFILAPATISNVANANASDHRPVVYASGTGNTVNISKVTVDGDGRGGARLYGVYYYQASGSFSDSRITRVRDASFSGVQSGHAFFANHQFDVSVSQSVTVNNNIIDDYQKTGVLINELNTHAIVTNNTITGQNIPNLNGQNGVQFGYGAYGTITGNTISNNIYNGPTSAVATGILLVGAGVDFNDLPTGNTTTVGNNILTGNEAGLYADEGGFGYDSNAGIVENSNTYSDQPIHVLFQNSNVTVPNPANVYDKRVDNTSQTYAVYGQIQRAVDYASATNVLNASAGTFDEIVTVNKALTLNGAQANNDADARFTSFASGVNGPKANASVETIVTPPTSNPVGANPGANDLFRVTANNVTVNGFVIDGNNPAIAGASTLQSGTIDIDARRGITNVGNDNGVNPLNNANIKYNIIQNVSQRGISIANNGPVSTGNIITENVIRSFGFGPDGGQAVILFTNAYADITNNTIDVPDNQIGLHLQNFFSDGTMTWSGNNVTVGQDGFGIHANLFYAPNATLNISNNTVNAATGVTGTSGNTWGINVWSVQVGSTVNVSNNTVGSAGGEFGRGINLWNLPTTATVTVSGGTVANSVVGVNLDNVDPFFEGAPNTTVNVNSVTITAAGGQTGIRARTDVVNAFTPAGNVTMNVDGAVLNTSGSGVAAAVIAPASSNPYTASLDITNSTLSGGATGILVEGSKASANIHGNDATITGFVVGVDVDGGSATLYQNNIHTNGTGVRVKNGGVLTSVTENFIKNNSIDNINIESTAGTIGVINYNDLDGAGGWAIANATATVIDGTCNWYGSALASAVAAKITGPVNYIPWLTNGTDNAPGTDGFQAVPGSCNGVLADYYVNDNVLTGDHYTTAVGNDANPGTAALPFRTIQHAIDVVPAGVNIWVDAGTYVEEVVVTKSVTINGSNPNVNPCSGVRVAESIIMPSVSQPFYDGATEVRLMQIEADNVVVKGFTFDGNNPSLVTNVIDAADGIDVYMDVEGITIQNNIFQNLNEGGVTGYPSGSSSLANNVISDNKFDNLPGNSDPGYPFSGYGIGVLVYNNFYANIDNNCMTNVRIGIQTGNYNLANTGPVPTINNNQVASNVVGIFHNLHYQNASPFTVDANEVTANDPGNTGMLLWSFQGTATSTITNNNITGGAVGIEAWNNPTSNTITVSGGTISGARVGVLATNYSSYGDAAASQLNITGITFNNCDTATWVQDHFSNGNSAAVTLNVNNATNVINGSGLGMLVQGANATVNFSAGAPVNFNSTLTKYIRLASNGTDVPTNNINAENAQFGGLTGAAMSLPQLFATENKIDHKIDWVNLGYVSVNANNDYVTTNSFYPGQTTTPAIQRGVDAASNGYVVNVDAGSFNEPAQINIAKNVTVRGQGNSLTIVQPSVNTTVGGNVPSESFIYIDPLATVTLEKFRIDGVGKQIHHAIQSRGSLTADDLDIRNIRYQQYFGRGIVFYSGTVNAVTNTTFSNIERIGIHVRGGVASPDPVASINGITYTGKGTGDFLDYGVEIGAGGNGTITNSVITNNQGVASVDGSTSAGILVTTFFGSGSTGSITNNYINNNTNGIAVGFNASDISTVTANYNDLSGNTSLAVRSTGPIVNATCNWFGTAGSGAIAAMVSPTVVYSPFLTNGTDDQPAAIGFQTSAPCIANNNLYVNDTYVVTDDHYTTSTGSDATGTGTPSAPFATIQKAISVASPGDVIWVDAGLYTQNPTVNKAVTINGSNAGADARVARPFVESVVRTNGNQAAIFSITSSNVVIDGFTVDGDDPSISGVTLKSGTDANAAHAIANAIVTGSTLAEIGSLTVQNNIIKNVSIGVRIQRNSGPASMGSLVTKNWFDAIGNLDFGYAVNLRNTSYADITDNKMTRVWTGLHTSGSFNLAGPATWTMSGNEIHSYASGLDYWLQFGSVTPLTFDNNQITAESGAVANNFGILMVSIQDAVNPSFTNNTITGTDYGIGMTNVPTSNSITLGSTNSITGTVLSGILLSNNLTFNPVGSSILGPSTGTATVNIDGININASAGNGITVDATGIPVYTLNIANPTTLNNGVNGLVIGGPNAAIAGNSINNLSFAGQTGQYVRLSNTALAGINIDATASLFDGTTGAAKTLAQNFATEDKINHRIDDATLGFVVVKNGHDFVTVSSFDAPNTTTASVQRGVDAATAGWTVNVGPGTFTDQVEIPKDLTVLGQGVGVTTILSPNTLPLSFTTTAVNKPIIYVHDAANVIINDITVDGAGKGNANNRFQGIAYRNAGGTVEDCEIKGIRNNPIDGVQGGVALFALADNGTARTLNVINNNIHDFQKNGMTLSGANLTVNVDGNTVTGAGTVNFIAQNGIQLSASATGSITDNIVSGFSYSPATFASAGILVFDASGSVTTSGNTVNNAQVGIWYINSSGAIQANTVNYNAVSMGSTPYWYGIDVENGMTTVTQNTVNGGGNGAGIEADYVTGDNTNMTATNNFVDNTDEGFVIWTDGGGSGTVTINYNSITNSVSSAIHNYGTTTQDGMCNWYGTANATIIATLVQGPVTYLPYLVNGTDDDPSTAGFQPVPGSCVGSPIVVTLVAKVDASCPNGTDGSIDIGVTGGSGSYTYLWSNTATTQDISGLAPGTYSVVVTDAVYGSTATLSVTINGTPDTDPPVITCPSDIVQNNDPGICGAVVTYTVSVTDNCTGYILQQTTGLPSGATFPVGTTINTFIVTDVGGNTATCSFTVTVNDAEPPVITCPTDIVANVAPNTCGAVVTYVPPVGTDNCAGATTTQVAGLPSGATFPVGTTVNTFKVKDANGNYSTCSFNVTVVDNQLPAITCPANMVVNNTAGLCGAVVNYTAPVGTDNCPGATTSLVAGLPSGSVFPVGTTTNVFVVVDASGNIKTCSFDVTVNDTESPTITCPADIIVNNDAGQCGAVVTFTAPVGTDNCAGATTMQIAGLPSGSFFPVGNTIVTFKVTDAVGNSTTCSFNITVNDNQNPTVTCPANITVSNEKGACGAVVTYLVPFSDNCPGATILQTQGLVSGSTFPVGTTTNSFTISDAHGQSVVCSFTVTVLDNESPSIVCPANITVTAPAGQCSAVVTYTTPVGTDNCGGANTNQTTGLPSGATFPVGTTVNTFVVTDASGNTATCSFTVTVVDNELPVITCPPGVTVNNDAGQCGAVVTYVTPVGTDNCSGATTTQVAGLPSGSMFPIGTTVNTFKVKDASGNVATCSFTVTVNDAELPVITCPANITISNQAGQCGATVSYIAPVGTDNCAGATTTQVAGLPSGSFFPVGTTTNTFIVTDASGQTATCSFTVTVNDTEMPAIVCPADITVNNTPGLCGATVTFTAPVGTDNCGGANTIQTTGLPSGSFFPVGTTLITYKVTDASGNVSTCSFNVVVNDTENPVISCPADITVTAAAGQCNAIVNYTTPVGTDNCPGSITQQTGGLASGSTFPVGTTLNTFTVTDAHGHSVSCSFNVTVVDLQNPTISCPADITVNAPAGQCSAVVTYTTPVGTDNCGGANTNQTTGLPSGATFPVGTTVNTFVVTDASGNTATCSFTVTVVDAELPVITCPANISVNNDADQCGAIVIYSAPVGTDNCAGATTTQIAGLPSGSMFPIGTTVNTFKVKDANGNYAVCSFTITVTDAQLPVISCPGPITVPNTAGQCGAIVNYTAPVGTDNCSGSTTIQAAGLPSGSTFPVGTTTNTFVVTDASGNIQTCSFTVTVTDTESPAFVCPDDIMVPNTPGQCGAVVNYTSPVGTDNCSGSVTVQTAGLPPGAFFPVGTTTNTFEVRNGVTVIATCSFDVTVTDSEPPVTLTIPNALGQCAVSVPLPATTDNCAGTVYGTTSDPLTYSVQGTYTIHWTFDDGNGNVINVDQTVIVDDTETPVPPSLPALSAQCSLDLLPTPVATDNCAGPVNGTTTTTLPITGQGVHSITWTFDDGNGNVSTAVQFVFINDVTAPVPPSSLPTMIDECGVTLTAPTATDNCSGTITGTTFTLFPITAQGTTIVTWLFDDGNGNVSTVTQTVIVNDVTPPVAPDLPVITAQCDVTVSAPTTTDNCAGTVTGVTVDPVTYNAQGTYMITWVFNDGNGNITIVKQTVIVDDTTPPVPPASLPDVTGACSFTPPAPTAEDNCVGTVTGTPNVTFPITAMGTTVVTWTFNDGNGNTSTVTQNVHVTDGSAPVITCPANITVSAGTHCSKFVNVPDATFSDDCGTVSTLTWIMTGATTGSSGSSGINQVGGKVFNAGTTVITYTATDIGGNTATCSFTVKVTETVLPTISCPSYVKVYTTGNDCFATGVNLGIPVTGDNCGVQSVTNNAPAQFPLGVTWVTWTVTDNSGNTKTCTQKVTVIDNQDPVISCPVNIVQVAGAHCQTLVTTTNPVYSDNCSVTSLTWCLSGATSDDSPSYGINFVGTRNFNVGVTTVTYTVKDAGGNTSTCSFTVKVEDNLPPSITCPSNIVASAGSNCSKKINVPNPTFSDNCSCVSVTWVMTGATSGSSYSHGINFIGSKNFNVGTTTVTYTAKDAYGNSAQCSFTVKVTENVLPTITCPSNKSVSASAGQCYATGVNLGSPKVNDNCGVASVTNNAPAQFPVGSTTVTWTVTDVSGNTRSCNQTVTVVDNQYPTVSCPANQTFCKLPGNTYTIPVLTATDNCGVTSITYQVTGATSRSGTGNDASGLFNVGTSTVKWTVKDAKGNTKTCSMQVVIQTDGICLIVRVNPDKTEPEVKPDEVKPVTNSKLEVINANAKLEVTGFPNPSSNYFNIKVKSTSKETVEIRMFDMLGKLVQQDRGAPEKIYRFGDNVVQGMYIVEVIQSGQKATIKLVKH